MKDESSTRSDTASRKCQACGYTESHESTCPLVELVKVPRWRLQRAIEFMQFAEDVPAQERNARELREDLEEIANGPSTTPHSERGTRDKKHAALYRRIRLKAWLDSCVDDLVVNTKQAKESEFNDGYDLMIETEYPFNEPAERPDGGGNG